MNKYYVMKLKFSTRKYFNNFYKRRKQKDGCAIHGIVHIIIDEEGIVKKMIPEIIKGEYRVTDLKLVKTKHYNKNVRDFRKRISWKPIKTEKKNIDWVILSKQEINKINKDFWRNKDHKPFLTKLSYLIGSNPSGAQSKKKNFPFIIDDPKEELKNYWNWNFTNSFKKFSNIKKDLFVNKKSLIEISLEQYFRKFQKINNKKTGNAEINPKYEFFKFNEFNLFGTDKPEIFKVLINNSKNVSSKLLDKWKNDDKKLIKKLMKLNSKKRKEPGIKNKWREIQLSSNDLLDKLFSLSWISTFLV